MKVAYDVRLTVVALGLRLCMATGVDLKVLEQVLSLPPVLLGKLRKEPVLPFFLHLCGL